MRNLRLAFSAILIFIIFFLGIKIYRRFNIYSDLKNEEKNRLKESAEILNNCFDLDNKSKRPLKKSMELIEYCLKKYGSEI